MPFVFITTLATPRLTLRPVAEDHLPALLAINGDDEVTRFLPYASWQTQADGQAWLQRMQALTAAGGAQQLVLERRDDGTVVGTLLLFRHDPGSGRIEVGYVLGRAFQRQGLMYEALDAVCSYAFDEMGVRRIEAEVQPANVASNRLLQRLGFSCEGLLRQRWTAKGASYDVYAWGLLRTDARPGRDAAAGGGDGRPGDADGAGGAAQATTDDAATPAPVTLREITADTLRDVLRLSVAESQKGFVATNAVSLAQAHFTPTAWYRAIYAGDDAAGFVMLEDETLADPPPERPAIAVWRFMIDQRFQGRGIGRTALLQVMAHVKAKAVVDRLQLSYVPGPGCPEPFYRGLGFRPTGEVDDGEVVMEVVWGGDGPGGPG